MSRSSKQRAEGSGQKVFCLLPTAFCLLLAGCVDSTVDDPYKERKLTAEEIREKLSSGDFRLRLEASKQIDALEPEERVTILLTLADDPQPSTRLLAARKLKSVDDARARAKLEKMAAGDPDPDVRELAGKGSFR